MPKIAPLPSVVTAPTVVYVDWTRFAERSNDGTMRHDSFLTQLPSPVGRPQDLTQPTPIWKGWHTDLLGQWRTPLSEVKRKGLWLPSTLMVTRGEPKEFELLSNALTDIADHATDEAWLGQYTELSRHLAAATEQRKRQTPPGGGYEYELPGWFAHAQYALAYLLLCGKLRLVSAQLEDEWDSLPDEQTLGEFVAERYSGIDWGDVTELRFPSNLLLHVYDVGSPPPAVVTSREADWCLACEERDRLDERIFRSLAGLLESRVVDGALAKPPVPRVENQDERVFRSLVRLPEVRADDEALAKPPAPRVEDLPLREVGFSALGGWLEKYARIAPLNTLDSAIATGRSEDIIRSSFGRILPAKGRDAEAIKRVKYLLSIATGVASFQIEGRPSYFTLLLTSDPLPDRPIPNLTELFRYAPGIPLQYRNRQFRSAIESSPSPNFVLCASLQTMRVDRCFSYFVKSDDVFRRQHFSDHLAKFHGVVIHTHQSGSVEVYNSHGLCMLGHGIQWFENPYDELRKRCVKFFIGKKDIGAGALAWRVCGIVANLVEQRASSIMLFAKKATIKKLMETQILSNMQACALRVNAEDDHKDEEEEQESGHCVKSRFYFEDVCRFLQIDGAHAISKTGEVIRFGMKIQDVATKNKLGGTGKSATKTIAKAIYEIEKDSNSFVVKVSGSGYYSLYQNGEQVTTPFDK